MGGLNSKNKNIQGTGEKLIKDNLSNIDKNSIYCYKCNKRFKNKLYFKHLDKCNNIYCEENDKL